MELRVCLKLPPGVGQRTNGLDGSTLVFPFLRPFEVDNDAVAHRATVGAHLRVRFSNNPSLRFKPADSPGARPAATPHQHLPPSSQQQDPTPPCPQEVRYAPGRGPRPSSPVRPCPTGALGTG